MTPGSYKKIVDEGMPLPKNEFHRGGLYIEFDVVFPKPSELDQKTRQHLAKLLPTPPGMGNGAAGTGTAGTASGGATPMDTSSTQEKSKEGEKETVEEVTLTDVNIEEERAKFQQQQRGMDFSFFYWCCCKY